MAQRRNSDRCEADENAPDALAEMSSGFLKAYAAWRVSSKMMRSEWKADVAPRTTKVHCMLSQSSVPCKKKKSTRCSQFAIAAHPACRWVAKFSGLKTGLFERSILFFFERKTHRRRRHKASLAAMHLLAHQSQASVASVTGRGRECLRPFRGQPVAVAPYQIRR